MQSYLYGKTHKDLGKKVYYLSLLSGSKISGLSLGIVESAKRGRHLLIPGGPILDWQNKELVNRWLEGIKKIARQENLVFVRIRPQILESPQNRKLLGSYGFRPAPMHLSAEMTLQLDLNESEKNILSQMRKNTRYEIRKAERLGIIVSREFNQGLLSQFTQLQLETAQRQRFVPFPAELVKSECSNFVKADLGVLYTAKYKGKILNQALIIHYPTESSYHLGASTLAGRKYPGAYAIQWAAILDAKKRGIPRYNFWGITEKNNKKHRYYGVSLFKRGFGGNVVTYIHAHDLIINNLRYLPSFVLETIRRKARSL